MKKRSEDNHESIITQKQYKADMNMTQDHNEGNNRKSGSTNNYTLNKTPVIEYTVPDVAEDSEGTRIVSIKLYDILGNLVVKLIEEEKYPGRHKCEFQADGMANGIYLCEFRVGDYSSMKQLILQKE